MHRLTRWAALAAVVSLILVAALAVAGSTHSGSITLPVGAQKVLTVRQVTRISVGDSTLVEVKSLGNDQVLLTGSRPGKTTLIVWVGDDGAQRTYDVIVKAEQSAESRPILDITPKSSRTVALEVGAKARYAVPGLQRVAVGDAAVADIETDEGGIVIKGLSKGKTTVLVWGAAGTQSLKVRVSGP